MKLLWISTGNRDKMMADRVIGSHEKLKSKNIKHVFRVNEGGHEPKVWKNDLYYFVPMLFQPNTKTNAKGE